MSLAGKCVSKSQFLLFIIRNICCILICVLCTWPLCAQAQTDSIEFLIETLTAEDGLPFRDVAAINQDENGMMWFGTPQGLIRYDGYHFKMYNSNKENPFFIPEEPIAINGIVCMENHRLMFLANSNLYLLDTKTDHVTGFGPDHGIHGKVLFIMLDHSKKIWLVVDDYLSSQDEKEQPKQYLLKQVRQDSFAVVYTVPRGSSDITQVCIGPEETIWWSTLTRGQLVFLNDGSMLRRIKPDSTELPGETIYPGLPFFTSGDEMFFMPNRPGIWKEINGRFEPLIEEQALRHSAAEDRFFYTAMEDRQGNIWFGSTRSIQYITPEGSIYDMTPFVRSRLAYGEVHQFFQDRQGVIWIATDFGLVKLKQKERLFEPYLKTDEESLSSTLRGFVETADGSVIVMNEHARQLYKLSPNGQLARFGIFEKIDNDGVSVINAARFFVTDSTRRYAYTANKFIVRIDLESGDYFVDTSFSPYPKVRTFNPVEILPDGRLVSGHTLSTLTIYDPASGQLEPLLDANQSIPDIENVRFLLKSRKPGFLWIGTNDHGVFEAEIRGKLVTHLSIDSKPALTNNTVLVLYESPDTSLWIGTFGGGINHYIPEPGIVRTFEISDGLSDNNVVGILPESDSILWVSTYNGLNRANINQESFRTFTVEDGLTHNEFNYASYFKDSQGRMYFGGMNGFVRFEPGIQFDPATCPAPFFTRLTRYDQRENRSYSTDLIQSNEPGIVISPYDTYFQVHWTMANYFEGGQNRYYAKLEGLEEEWNYLENRPYIRFYSLDPGRYTLRIRGVDSKGNEAVAEAILPVTVKPVFYRTWWFIALLGLFLAAAVYTFFQYRLIQLLKIEKLRTKISSDLHDDLGSMLAGLAMQSEILEHRVSSEHKAGIRRITTISRNAVQRMRDLVWSIDARKDRVSDLLEKMRETAEELLLPGGFKYALHIEGFSNRQKKLTINARQNLFFIFKEALHNIVKHSNGDLVVLRLHQDTERLSLVIRDNGTQKKGFTEGKTTFKNTGQGLMNMQMRARRLHGSCQVKQDEGFEIQLEVPVNHIFM